MAKVIFTAVVASITGKLAGTTFQRSFGGAQMHTKVSPVNRNTPAQNAIRLNMQSLTKSWGSLSADDRRSWQTGDTPAARGFHLYLQRNQNLFIAGLPGITTFVQPRPPLVLTQEVLSIGNDPFSAAVTVNVDSPPHGYTQVNRWTLWRPPGVSRSSHIGRVLWPGNFQWDADASSYNFDPARDDYPPGPGWSAEVAYGAIENASGFVSLSNYLLFTQF